MFAPDDMSRQEAELTVTTESLSEEGGIVWRYPIGGQPRLLRPASSSEVPQIQCTAKERLEQRLEVRLLGSAGTGKPRATAGAVTLRPVTPGASGGGQLDPIGVAEGAGYRYRLVCGDPEAGPLLEQSTGVRLMRSEEDASGDAVLVFGVVFSPSKPFRYARACMCVLCVVYARFVCVHVCMHLSVHTCVCNYRTHFCLYV